MDKKQTGRIGLAMAIAYYTKEGYTISIPINDTQWYDLIIEKDGVFQSVQCKATSTEEGTIDFRSTGGTKGDVYDNLINHKELGLLFCVNKDLVCYSIPMQDILDFGCKHSIRLRTQPNANKQGFETYKYIVNITS